MSSAMLRHNHIFSKASMLYAALGDSIGFKNGEWEFNFDVSAILAEVDALGGVGAIKVNELDWPVSDDTIMHLATCCALWQALHPSFEARREIADCIGNQSLDFKTSVKQCAGIIVDSKSQLVELRSVLLQNPPSKTEWKKRKEDEYAKFTKAIMPWYTKCMTAMNGRAPGRQSLEAVSNYLSRGEMPPFVLNPRAGGNGAAMRSMCIGLISSLSKSTLVALASIASAATHPNYVGILGGVMTAALTQIAMYSTAPPSEWVFIFFEAYYPLAISWMKHHFPNEPEDDSFHKTWQKYLSSRFVSTFERGIPHGKQAEIARHHPIYPSDWLKNAQYREEYYADFAYISPTDGGHWNGSSGHDAVIIAYDSLLFGGGDWHTVLYLSAFHGGDSDSTASIAGALFGASIGMRTATMEGLEFQESIVNVASALPLL